MEVRKVGSFFDGSQQYMGKEGMLIDIRNDEPTLFYFTANCNQKLIDAIRQNMITGHLISLKGIIFIMLDIQGYGVMDASYHIQENSPDARDVPAPDEDGYIATFYLINSRTGILEAVRMISFRKQFSDALYQAIQEQLNAPHDHQAFLENINTVYAKYSDSTMKKLSLARFKQVGSVAPTHVIEGAAL